MRIGVPRATGIHLWRFRSTKEVESHCITTFVDVLLHHEAKQEWNRRIKFCFDNDKVNLKVVSYWNAKKMVSFIHDVSKEGLDQWFPNFSIYQRVYDLIRNSLRRPLEAWTGAQ